MALDWCKVQKSTPRKPEVLRLASILKIHPDHAFGLCFRFWSWCDDQLTDCHAFGVTVEMVDGVVCHDGFADALIKVSWLQVRNGSLEIPNFDRHLSESAKIRALSSERKRKQRDNDVTDSSENRHAKSVTKTRPEKRREENNTNNNTHTREGSMSNVDQGFLEAPNEDFERFWEAYPRKIGKAKAWQEWDAAVCVVQSTKPMIANTSTQWLITKAREFAASNLGRTGGKFIPGPAKWLSESRFFDDPEEWEKEHGNNRSSDRTAKRSSQFENNIDALSNWADNAVSGQSS